MDRKLASIQRIDKLEPIPGADRIEKATVMGWSVVVQKGLHEEGDLCVFCEIDSVLPSTAEWAQFMEPRKFRVKTAKLRKCLSQGLCFPLFDMPELDPSCHEVGDDVSEQLGIIKYEPPVPSDEISGPFPGEIPKTDEIRLQSALGVLDEIRTRPFYVTVKLDGSSGTFYKKDGELIVCSRNWALKEGGNPHWRVAERYDLAEKLEDGFCIQGEVCGPGIQRNRLGLEEPDLFVFDVYSAHLGAYLRYDQLVLFCHNNGLKTVPYEFEVESDELEEFPFTLDNFIELAKGKYDGTDRRREGIVIRPVIEARSEALGGDRLSFKVINNDFLLKDEE